MNILSAAEVEPFLQLEPGDNADLISELISLVSVKTARYTGRTDWGDTSSRTEYRHGGAPFFTTGYWPILTMQVFDDVAHEWAANTEVDSTFYYADSQGVVWSEGGCFSQGQRNLKIIYTGGYASVAAVPAKVKKAGLIQVEKEYNARVRVRGGDSSEVDLAVSAMELLQEYRRICPVMAG